MNSSLDNSIAHIVNQTRANISFLQSAQKISSEDARIILDRLPGTPESLSSLNGTSEATVGLSMPVASATTVQWNNPPPPTRNPSANVSALSRPPPPVPAPFLFKARAMWGYNEDGKEAGDLTFSTGSIIEILDDKNPDWWSGRLNGKQGLFPSSYVERLPDESHLRTQSNFPEKGPLAPNLPSSSTYPSQPSYPQQNPYYGPPHGAPPSGPYPQYQTPQSGPYPPYQAPPNGPYPAYQQPPTAPPPPSTVTVNTEEGKKKTGLFQGKLGNTLAQSAVGGVGFGAGSAVGSGIINSIF